MNIRKSKTNINSLQRDLSAIVGKLQEDPTTIYEINRYSKTSGYLVSTEIMDGFLEYLEEMEMFGNKDLVTSLLKAKIEFDNGQGESLEEVLKEINNE